jgi:hypothetical protein
MTIMLADHIKEQFNKKFLFVKIGESNYLFFLVQIIIFAEL